VRSEAQKEARRRYEASDRGKQARKRHEATYVASGKRAVVEAKRSLKPVSSARLTARKKWADANKPYFAASRSLRRALFKEATDFDRFVFIQAAELAALRKGVVGGEWHVDHVTPVSRGGGSTADNLQVVPASWNRRKSNKHTERFFGCL
jgi:hypothetical protein